MLSYRCEKKGIAEQCLSAGGVTVRSLDRGKFPILGHQLIKCK